jgi:hypothetical protein
MTNLYAEANNTDAHMNIECGTMYNIHNPNTSR